MAQRHLAEAQKTVWPIFLLFGGSFSTRNSLALARQVPSRHRKGTQLLHAGSRPGPSHWNSPCALDEWSAGAGLQVGAARAPSTGVVWPLSLRLRALADGLQVPGTGGRAQVSSVVSVVSDGISAGGTSVLGLGIPAGVTLRRKDCVSQGRFSVSRWDGGSAGWQDSGVQVSDSPGMSLGPECPPRPCTKAECFIPGAGAWGDTLALEQSLAKGPADALKGNGLESC